jgi:AAT family amino acid transporter/GABA permease
LAGNGDAPKALTSLSERRVPVRAILTGSAFGYAALIASVISPSGVFSFLVNASGAAMLVLYFIIGAAQIRHRSVMPAAQADALSLKMWLFPWLSYATQAGILAVLIAMAFFPDLASQLYTTLLFVTLLGLLYFALRKPLLRKVTGWSR